VTATAPITEHPWPIRRRVRRSAKKSFHVSCGGAVGAVPDGGCDEADVAFRTMILLGKEPRMAGKARCGCWSLVFRVHVENEGVALAMGAMIVGG
jgi:hypothetical protein